MDEVKNPFDDCVKISLRVEDPSNLLSRFLLLKREVLISKVDLENTHIGDLRTLIFNLNTMVAELENFYEEERSA